MRKIWRKAKVKEEKRFFINHQIRAQEVFVINEEGERLGVFPLGKALTMAQDVELDLVEVNPKGEPPVCKIMDFGQFKYELEKKSHKQKAGQKKVETKVIRLTVRMGQHDFEMRVDQAAKFLERRDKVKIELALRGRERQHPQKAYEVILKFMESLEAVESLGLHREQDLTKQGDRYSIIVVNKGK